MCKKILLGLILINLRVLSGDFREILTYSEQLMNPQIYHAKLRMIIFRKDKESVYIFNFYKEREDRFLIYFLYPEREKNKALLRNKENLLFYLPSIRRCINISFKQSFMGGDFDNLNLVRVNLSKDYEILEVKEEEYFYIFHLKAKDKTIAYPKAKIWIDKKDYLYIKHEYYTEEGKLLKILEFSDPKKLGKRIRPSFMKMENALIKDNYTTLQILDFKEQIYNLKDFLNKNPTLQEFWR